jgi:hypothetical protein
VKLALGEGEDLAEEHLGARLKVFLGVGTNGTAQLFHVGAAPGVLCHGRGADTLQRSRKLWSRDAAL